MKHFQIIILFVVVSITTASAQHVEFEYNEFGERIVKTSPCTIDTKPIIVQVEGANLAKKVVSYHPNPIIDYLEIEFKSGTYSIVVSDVSGKKLRQFDDVSENLSIDFTEFTSGAYIIKVSDNVHAEVFKVIKK
ncbi:MAG: T9SS type A sorting domain-containing protein [Bacteroidales bacterium]|nr:T9SS type A sorting domain-containing protein [Bacteroidales bacterium]